MKWYTSEGFGCLLICIGVSVVIATTAWAIHLLWIPT